MSLRKKHKSVEKTNQLIKRTLGEEFLIGHSYFIENKDNIDDYDTWYRAIVEYDIIPIIEEYYYDDNDRITEFKDILGV